MLSGALSGGGCSRPVDQLYTHENSFCVIAIDVEAIRPLAAVTTQIDDMIDYVTDSASVDDASRVLYPYERELLERERRLKNGIDVEQPTWDKITDLARSLNVPV